MTAKRYLNNLDSLIAAFIGFYVIYLYTKYSGVGLSPDSIMYASTATNIQAHGSLLTFNKHPITFFPVFYPFFLGVIQFFSKTDPIKAGALIDASLFAGVIFTTGWIMSRFINDSRIWVWNKVKQSKLKLWILVTAAVILIADYVVALGLSRNTAIPDNLQWLGSSFFVNTVPASPYCWFLVLFRVEAIIVAGTSSYKRLILAAIILSPGLLEIYTYLWSETLFILEILFFVLVYWRYLQSHTLNSLAWVAIITAIACITRYVGITIIGTGGLMLLLDNQLLWKKKIGHILFYSGISVSLLVANLILNSRSTGLSTGTREPSITPFGENLHFFGTVISDWGALGSGAYPYAALIAAIVLIALIAVLLWKALKGKVNSYENILIAFAIVYGLFIVIWASIQRFEHINSRLLAPMFIPLLIACTSWVPDVLKLLKSNARYVLAGVAIVLMLAFECATYQADWQRYDDENDYGVPGYSDDDWNKSEFVIYLKHHKNIFKPTVPIYTDADEAVYLFTGMSSTLIPHKFFKADVQKFYNAKHFYLIWFDNLANPELLNLQDIMLHKKLVKIGAVKQGEVYYCDER
ncbi:MAG TPA: hypothetical protein VFE53_23780 [Mucilaginibacter sp.]|jgi:hypothetical protein|nr:hypothetical protein [Mucilaginibacter sp.]